MGYLAFARKYRPKTFLEVVGQQDIAITLQNIIQSNRLHHAYIFSGSKGVGKTSMARIFAKALNCEHGPTITPCNACELCIRIGTGEDIDVVEIDGASNRGIEEIRNIKENVKYLTSRARFKIFIIDEVHMLTTPAFNALLKTLEEPPAHVKFILATTQLTSIPDTILSRCQRFTFKKIHIQDIVTHLERVSVSENIAIDGDVLELIARAAGGAMRDSVVLFEQLASYGDGKITREMTERFLGNAGQESLKILESIRAKDAAKLIDMVREFLSRGDDPNILADKLIHNLRDILVAVATGKVENFVEGELAYQKWVAEQSRHFTQEFCTAALQHLIEAKNLIHRSLMGGIVLEMILLKISRYESLVSLKKIEETLLSMQGKMVVSPPSPMRMSDPKILSQVPAAPHASPLQEEKPRMATDASSEKKTSEKNAASRDSMSNQPPDAIFKTPEKSEKSPNQNKPLPSLPAQASSPLSQGEPSTAPPKDKPTTEVAWNGFLSDLGTNFQRAAGLLKESAQFELKDRFLMLRLPREFHFIANIFSLPANRKLIDDLIARHFGAGFGLRLNFYGEDESAAVSNVQEVAMSDPTVRQLCSLFEGRVASVQKVSQPVIAESGE